MIQERDEKLFIGGNKVEADFVEFKAIKLKMIIVINRTQAETIKTIRNVY